MVDVTGGVTDLVGHSYEDPAFIHDLNELIHHHTPAGQGARSNLAAARSAPRALRPGRPAPQLLPPRNRPLAARPLKLLLSNDDGIDAPGLQALAEAAAAFGETRRSSPPRPRNPA